MTEPGSGYRRYRGSLFAAVVLCALVAIGTTGLTGVAAAEDGVTDCTVVDESGTYVLENDVSADQTGDGAACIEILADDVVFDGNGHAVVAGDPVEWRGGNHGIHVSGASNVTVRNVSVTGWNELGTGLAVNASTAVLLSGVETENNTFGTVLRGVDSVEFADAEISRSHRAGLQLLDSSSVLVRDTVVSENAEDIGWTGVDVRGESTTRVEFENVTVEDSRTGGHGIHVVSSGPDVSIANSTMSGNDGTGLLVDSDGVSVTDSESTGNLWGVTARDDASVPVAGLDVGASTAPGTTLDLVVQNARLRANASPPANPAAEGIGRYVQVESFENASLAVGVHYEAADVGDVDENSLSLWRFDGTQWVEVPGSSVSTESRIVAASPTGLPASERSTVGVFGTARVASFDVSAVNETVIQGEPLAVKLTNVTDDGGEPFTGSEQFNVYGPNGSSASVKTLIEDGEQASPFTLLDGEETENLEPGEYEGLEVVRYDTRSDEDPVNDTYDVSVVASPVASFDVSPVNETVIQGEQLAVKLTNVTHVRGGSFDGSEQFNVYGPNGSSASVKTLIEDGEQASPFTLLDGEETENLETGEYTGLEVILYDTLFAGDESINDTYGVDVMASPVASFDVSAVNETVVQGEPLDVVLTNVTHVRGGAFSGSEQFNVYGPNGSSASVKTLIEDGEQASPFTLLDGAETENLQPGEYAGLETVLYATYFDEEPINATYDVTVRATTFEVESEFAGVVHDDTGLEIAASWLPVRNGEATLSIAGRTISDPVTIENRNVSATVDLSEHLDPETETGPTTIFLSSGDFLSSDGFLVAAEVRLVHEAYDLGEGYTRWSIPQPAAVYVTDGVVDATRWRTGTSTYDDVGFEVNTGAVVADGEALHEGLYVNAETADDRIGFDFVTPGEDGLAPGGAEPIEPGWNLLGSNYDASSGNQTLNLDLNTVTSLPATAADYEGDEGMVAHDPRSFVRIGGDDVIDPYDTYWVYVDVGESGETRAITTAEYDPSGRVAILDDEDA